jgi:hypothetical protein
MANSYDILVTKGESFLLEIIAKDEYGAPMNLSGYQASGLVKLRYSDTGYLLNLSPTISNAPSGTITVNLSGSLLSNLPVTQAFYSIDISTGSFVQNVLCGNFLIAPCVIA